MMTYADAIRLGSLLKPQGFGLTRNRFETACANDAALLAIGAGSSIEASILEYFEEASLSVSCPVCDWKSWRSSGPSILGGTVAHLNDEHRWTREAIADWVDTVVPPVREAVPDAGELTYA